MKKPTACIFGHNGGIGHATRVALLTQGYRIIPVDRKVLDLNTKDADREIDSLLTNAQPDVIINAAGIFINGYDRTHHETMNVNFGSNWSIVRHYSQQKNQSHTTRIIMIGSNSHTGGRRLYPLYSASKAALYNLWQSAQEQLADTAITVDLVNPVRTLTKMSSAGKTVDPALEYLRPEQVAEKIIMLIKENLPSRCLDITFEDTK